MGIKDVPMVWASDVPMVWAVLKSRTGCKVTFRLISNFSQSPRLRAEGEGQTEAPLLRVSAGL